MASALPVFPAFSVHESAAEQSRKKWTKRLQNLLVGMNIKDNVRQRALLLHYAGEEVNDIFDTLQETGEDYDTSLTKLTEYFAPKKNVEYEIYKFRHAKQETNETIDAFHTKRSVLNNKCRNCGGVFPHRWKCPAQGKSCNFCKKLNHFEKMCRSKRNAVTKRSVNTLENSDFENNFECQSKIDSSSDDECVFELPTESKKGTVNSLKHDQPRICAKINESNINVLIDTSSSTNVIDEDTYNRMKRKPKLIDTKTKVFAYGSQQNLEFVGKFDTVIETRDKLKNSAVYVSKACKGTSDNPANIEARGTNTIYYVKNKKDIFHGLGKLKDTQVKIHVDNTVKPIVQPHRRIPFHVRKQVEAELERLERLDIIERVHGPTPWVPPIVVAPKPKSPGEIRICLDMRLPNQAIQRERHIASTIDDLIVDLNGA
ncbi:unnamed protein product [Mytilus coruscus]|uniref:Peptidase A2 domain-containing protein n=1 Tax=Mytilus coruscus TaxID=42192 RepID=A0A6J8C4X5_MYTCO|nr:unnamed protein product [Mytilus coruscus]